MDDKLSRIRTALPAVHEYAYLNAGTCGPLPLPTIDALAAAAADEAQRGRIRFEMFMEQRLPQMAALREAFASLLDASADEIAITHNTTEGINIAVWGQPWRPGDEILVTDLEHEGGVMPAILAARRFDLKFRTIGLLDVPPTDIANVVADHLSDRSRLLMISHVSWANGVRVPLAEIAAAAHARGCKVAVDAAQSAGATPASMRDLGVDYYAVPGQKWLCGPEGMGALYVSAEAQETLAPTYTGYFALPMADHHAWSCFGHLVLAANARQYEASSIYWPGISGMLASLQWLEGEVGWEWIFERMARLHAHARETLGRNPRLRPFTPEPAAGLLHFYLPDGADPEQVNTTLVERGYRIRTIPHMNCLRISTGFWNTEEEIDGLAAVLDEAVSG